MCWVMPPASPATTFVRRIASSSEVLPWSTCPITVTTGARGADPSADTSFAGSRKTSSRKPTSSTSAPKRSATLRTVSTSIDWLIETIVPSAIRRLCTVAAFSPSRRARSPTAIARSTRSTRFSGLAARTAAGRGDGAPSRRRRRGERSARGSTVTWRRTEARLVACRARFSCSRTFTNSRTRLRSFAARSASTPPASESGRRFGRSPAGAAAPSAASASTGDGAAGAAARTAGSSGSTGSGRGRGSSSGSDAGSSTTGPGSGTGGATTTGGGGSGAGAFLRRRITAAPLSTSTRFSVTSPSRGVGRPSLRRRSSASSSSSEAMALFSARPSSTAFATSSAFSIPSSSASLYARIAMLPPRRSAPAAARLRRPAGSARRRRGLGRLRRRRLLRGALDRQARLLLLALPPLDGQLRSPRLDRLRPRLVDAREHRQHLGGQVGEVLERGHALLEQQLGVGLAAPLDHGERLGEPLRELAHLRLALDVDPPARELDGEAHVLPLAPDRQRELVVGHDHVHRLRGVVDDHLRHLRRGERGADVAGGIGAPRDDVDALPAQLLHH